jgi:hypothetical protein
MEKEMSNSSEVAEIRRLDECRAPNATCKKWGPYLSERQWGTVREDYSDNGDAWNYFSHDQARSRAYRWGESSQVAFSEARLPFGAPMVLRLGEGSQWKIRERATKNLLIEFKEERHYDNLSDALSDQHQGVAP